MAGRRTPPGTAVVLPGRGYGPDHPGLYYTRMALVAAGWSVHPVTWDGLPEDPRAWPGYVQDRVGPVLDAVRPGLVVGKSLGSHALPLAAERGLPGIWLTPLLVEPAPAGAALRLPVRSLLVGGLADPSWDGAVASRGAQQCGYEVLEIAGADHGFDVGGDPAASLRSLGILVGAVTDALGRWSALA